MLGDRRDESTYECSASAQEESMSSILQCLYAEAWLYGVP